MVIAWSSYVEGALISQRKRGGARLSPSLPHAFTDANGNYLFTEVPPGECLVEIDPATAPPDKVPGMCPLIVSVDLQAGESFLDADFCFVNPPPGCIGDTVWCDADDDGIQDAGEPGIPDVIVLLLCAGPDGIFGTADDDTDMFAESTQPLQAPSTRCSSACASCCRWRRARTSTRRNPPHALLSG